MPKTEGQANNSFFLPLMLLIVLMLIWQLATKLLPIDPVILPSPASILQSFRKHHSELLAASWHSGCLALAGFSLSLLVGMIIAFFMAQSKIIERSLYPYAIFLQTVPIIGIAPIIITWFGPGTKAVIVISFIISLFPVITNTTAGLLSPKREWLELLNKASRWQMLLKIRIPAAIPYIVTGAKISAGLSVVGAIVGEYFTGLDGQQTGLAYLLLVTDFKADYPYLFATVISSAIMGLIIFIAVSLIGGVIVEKGHFQE